MHTANQWSADSPGWPDRARNTAERSRDWLDARGKAAWIIAMIAGFIVFWPIGLALLAYMIWSNRMGCKSWKSRHQHRRASGLNSTGNTAFDSYREETLKRLEEEHEEFLSFLAELRAARDRAEFDQFMARRSPAEEAPAV